MYPFLHLLPGGELFIFVNKDAQIFAAEQNIVTRQLPSLEGMSRTYPNTGGSVLLPLTPANNWQPEIMVCGGGAYQDYDSGTDATCGRISPIVNFPEWEIESMPDARVMVEGTLLPDGTVLWCNGAHQGAEGFGLADDPAYNALIYNPSRMIGNRFEITATAELPRLYHSVALLLLDGTVLISGSNPNEMPLLVDETDLNDLKTRYPTEFRQEIYTPHYLTGDKKDRRPYDLKLEDQGKPLKADGRLLKISYQGEDKVEDIRVVLYHGGFVTHGLHMNQRMVELRCSSMTTKGDRSVMIEMPDEKVVGPGVLPPGPYVLYLLVNGIPSVGQFVMVE